MSPQSSFPAREGRLDYRLTRCLPAGLRAATRMARGLALVLNTFTRYDAESGRIAKVRRHAMLCHWLYYCERRLRVDLSGSHSSWVSGLRKSGAFFGADTGVR